MKFTPATAQVFIDECLAEGLTPRAALIDDSFPKQAAFIRDPSRLKAARCTRRAGKSYGIGLYLFKTCIDNPGASCIYIGLTRESAKRIILKDVLRVINRKYNLGAQFNETSLTVSFPNGSVIYLIGMDSNEDESRKALGQKFKLAVIDEAAFFRQDLRQIVYGVLKPATVDEGGTIVLIGTPSPLNKGLFFEITNGQIAGWAVHRWNTFDNRYMAKQWAEEIADLKRDNPGIEETPLYKQMYLGEWTIDISKLVYKFSDDKNLIDKAPDDLDTFVLGVDLGYSPDPSAFVVCGYNDKSSNLYIVHSYKRKEMTFTAVAEKIKHLQGIYPISKVVIDNANKQGVEEMRSRYEIPFVPAEKQGKADFIEICNSELIMGRIKFVDAETIPLQDEIKTLIWDETKMKREEHSACANHCCDGFLYAFRDCFQYLFQPKVKPKLKTPQDLVDDWEEMECERLETVKAQPFWEKDWN